MSYKEIRVLKSNQFSKMVKFLLVTLIQKTVEQFIFLEFSLDLQHIFFMIAQTSFDWVNHLGILSFAGGAIK